MYFTDRWKRELHNIAANLRKRLTQRRWPYGSEAAVEKVILVAFYVIRKLIESEAVPADVADWSVEATTFPSKGRPVTRMFWPTVDEYFDMETPKVAHLKLSLLCGYIVHSHVFTPWFGHDRELRGVFIASDRTVKTTIYRISLEEIIRVVDAVSSERIPNAFLRFGPEENRIIM